MERDRVYVDARTLATAWLAVFQASGTDPDLPLLYRALTVSWAPDALRLEAMDGYLLARSWAPIGGATPDDVATLPGEPHVIEASATVRDHDRRGRALMTYLLARTGKKDAVPFNVAVHAAPAPPEEMRLDGTEGDVFVLDVPDEELLALPAAEVGRGGNLDTESVLAAAGRDGPPARDEATRPDALIGHDLMLRVSRIGKLLDAPVRWWWGDRNRPVRFEVRSDFGAYVVGALSRGK